MSKQQAFKSIRGMNDLIPPQSQQFEYLANTIKKLLTNYGYKPIITPIMENTGLFSRSIGAGTDVVEKEMFTFLDSKDSLTLRPEATAGIARAVIQNGLTFGTHKLWTAGPMFRRERPQKGRYRQFNQISVECFGMPEPQVDAEQILLLCDLWKKLEISDNLKLEINTLATTETRDKYRAKLVTYFNENLSILDEDSKRRLEINPLRILDSKNPAMFEMLEKAPKLLDYLDAESEKHFAEVLSILDSFSVPYSINPKLVRGLDYYNHTVFEWTTDKLGAQSAVCGGGRYDGLTSHIGGKPCPAVGFAIGLERILLLIEELGKFPSLADNNLAYFVLLGKNAKLKGLELAKKLRNNYPNKIITVNLQDISFKAQLKKADQEKSKYAVIIGDDEIKNNVAIVKNLFTGQQESVSFDKIEFEV